MTDQLSMTDLLQAADDDYYQQRAVKVSWFEECATPDCKFHAWVDTDTAPPFYCVPCKLERKESDATNHQ